MKNLIIGIGTLFLMGEALGKRPEWTERSSYESGDKLYFVGLASNANSEEEGRKTAFGNAVFEVKSLLQLEDMKGLPINTQRNYAEPGSKPGLVSVWRLMFVYKDRLTAHLKKAGKSDEFIKSILSAKLDKIDKTASRIEVKLDNLEKKIFSGALKVGREISKSKNSSALNGYSCFDSEGENRQLVVSAEDHGGCQLLYVRGEEMSTIEDSTIDITACYSAAHSMAETLSGIGFNCFSY